MDLTNLTTTEYISANKELQRRIKVLEEKVSSLKRENGNILTTSTKLLAEVKELKSKISYKEEVIRKYQMNKEILPSRACNTKGPTKSKNKPQRVKSRKKVIYGILKNKEKYKLNDIEIKFLTNIQNLQVLSQKQYDWLEGIKKRIK